MHPSVPRQLSTTPQLRLSEAAMFYFYSSQLRLEQMPAVAKVVRQQSDVVAVILASYAESKIVDSEMSLHHEDGTMEAKYSRNDKAFYGTYLILARSAVNSGDIQAIADLDHAVDTVALAFGDGAVADLHFNALYRRDKLNRDVFHPDEFPLAPSIVRGTWNDVDLFTSLLVDGSKQISLLPEAGRLLRLASNETNPEFAFILAWTAFEYQLRTVPGKTSGERRIYFMRELQIDGVDLLLQEMFSARNPLLKGERYSITIRNIRFITKLTRVLAVRGSSLYRPLADKLLEIDSETSALTVPTTVNDGAGTISYDIKRHV